jgi:hypothetical protein
MLAERARMSKHNPVANAINYMLDGEGRWEPSLHSLMTGAFA